MPTKIIFLTRRRERFIFLYSKGISTLFPVTKICVCACACACLCVNIYTFFNLGRKHMHILNNDLQNIRHCLKMYMRLDSWWKEKVGLVQVTVCDLLILVIAWKNSCVPKWFSSGHNAKPPQISSTIYSHSKSHKTRHTE